jgi:hypothetical protein
MLQAFYARRDFLRVSSLHVVCSAELGGSNTLWEWRRSVAFADSGIELVKHIDNKVWYGLVGFGSAIPNMLWCARQPGLTPGKD